jgi:transient receptor potential cation channel subfamily M protein 3
MGLCFPPYLLALEFKSREELQLMPQTMEEHLDDLEEGGADVQSQRRLSVSSFDDSQVNEEYNHVRQAEGGNLR